MTDIDETINLNGATGSDWAATDAAAAHGIVTDTSSGAGDTEGPNPGAGAADSTAPEAPAVVPMFLSELVTAMRSVAGRERERIATMVAEDVAVQTEDARRQAVSEEDAFRRLADEDVAEIEAWADREVERIRADAAQRVADRRSDLETTLEQQESVLQAEIDEIERAATTYVTELDGFFEDLESENDPAEIAHRAAALPTPPNLAEVRTLTRTAALTQIAERAAGAPMADVETAGEDGDGPGDDAFTDAAPTDTAGTHEVEADGTMAAEPGPDQATVADEGGDRAFSAEFEAATGAETAEVDEVGIETAEVDDAIRAEEAAPVEQPAPSAIASDPWRDLDDWVGRTKMPATSPMDTTGGTVGEDRPVGGTGWELPATPDADEVRPVAVMDPPADGGPTWPASDPVAAHPLGHPNAAVRLIRSVAPWTAPNHDDRSSTQD